MMLYALLTAVSMVILIMKLPRRIKEPLLRQQWLTDIIITFVVIMFFAGTFSGMLVGVMSGLIVSAMLPFLARMYFRPQPQPHIQQPQQQTQQRTFNPKGLFVRGPRKPEVKIIYKETVGEKILKGFAAYVAVMMAIALILGVAA